MRFVARTRDGMEIYSELITLKPGESGARQARIAAAYWGHANYMSGDTAYACAAAFDAEGATVRFVIETSSGGSWSPAGNLRSVVTGEKAVVAWKIPELAKGTKIRFRAETPISKQTSIESVISAPAAEEVEPEAATAAQEKAEPAGKLTNPRWDKKAVVHGDTIVASVDAAGLDGKQVEFSLERLEGKKWVADGTAKATVKNGVATAQIKATHPGAAKSAATDLGSRKLRFRARVA